VRAAKDPAFVCSLQLTLPIAPLASIEAPPMETEPVAAREVERKA